ncbi:hypothetical protein P8C59_001079 [Phyllachora maydis]|uniref:Ribosomal RNA-processing protein 40 n=1 Tax=Phyllachora maydis TaxID=1825666 RepID=A0AAD9HXH6_9PEZI|nr:hypothetical protein P8C59_001079 [Phyllachora maydis]
MAAEKLIVLPGDTIDPALIPSHPKHPLRLGPGLRHVPPTDIVPTVAGQLVTDARKNSMWIEHSGGRYIPSPSDLVLGQVLRSTADSYLVSLGPYTAPASLPHLAFEGASKKTRAQLPPGAAVYARVALANRHMDAELECVSAATGRADGLGPLAGGCVFDVSTGLARRLMMAPVTGAGAGAGAGAGGAVAVLEMLAGEGALAFETAVGRNGRVWVGSEDVRTVVLVGRALAAVDAVPLDLAGQEKLVKRLLREAK